MQTHRFRFSREHRFPIGLFNLLYSDDWFRYRSPRFTALPFSSFLESIKTFPTIAISQPRATAKTYTLADSLIKCSRHVSCLRGTRDPWFSFPCFACLVSTRPSSDSRVILFVFVFSFREGPREFDLN